ncbi:MAG: hypothetical protein LBL19_02580 [Spirochaetaceae bacterium]|jgi:hypothetical protein|nr:hypothetical protein [Spirochaetaceae bacterium]
MAHKKRFLKIPAAALALAAVFILAGCGGFVAANNDDALYELAGRWYDCRYDFAFEITQSGEGYIAQSKTQCVVSVLGSFVDFRDSRDRSMGSFNYSLKNGALTMTLGKGDFSSMQSSSPFSKSGSIPSGGMVPVEFIGQWYAKTSPPSSPNFEITAAGGMTISGSTAYYTAIVSGNKISVLDGSVLKGEFLYSFMYGELIITNGTDLCAGLAVLSPFIKSGQK